MVRGFAYEGANPVDHVEVSFDDGVNWFTADGTESFQYVYTVPQEGTYTIKSRATDTQSVTETPGPGIQVTVEYPTEAPIASGGSKPMTNTEARLIWCFGI